MTASEFEKEYGVMLINTHQTQYVLVAKDYTNIVIPAYKYCCGHATMNVIDAVINFREVASMVAYEELRMAELSLMTLWVEDGYVNSLTFIDDNGYCTKKFPQLKAYECRIYYAGYRTVTVQALNECEALELAEDKINQEEEMGIDWYTADDFTVTLDRMPDVDIAKEVFTNDKD